MFTGTTTLAVAEQLPTDGKARQSVMSYRVSFEPPPSSLCRACNSCL